jgi:hypothetical protein
MSLNCGVDAGEALRAAFVAALCAIPKGRRTLMPDPDAPEEEAEGDGVDEAADHNPLASLLGDYRRVLDWG